MMDSEEETTGYRCPMEDCGIVMSEGGELRAHLKWDHHWSAP
jgi:hypothetical protein